MHLFDDVLHDLDGAGRACHDTGAHMRKVGRRKVLVLQHCDEHGGDTVECRDLQLVYAVKRNAGREIRDRAKRSAVRDRGGHCKHHSEAVEHGHLDHKPVGGGKIHTVADVFAVVDDIVVRQHDALGESGCAGGVLHVADVVLVDGCGAAIYLPYGGVFGKLKRFVPGETALLFAADGYNVAQEGQTFGIKRLVLGRCRKLGAELCDDICIRGVLVALCHDKRVCVGLTEQIFRLINLISGVHRNKHRADLDGCPECDIPLRHVCRPDCHMIAALDAEADKRTREPVNVVAELRICAVIIAGGVTECVLIGEFVAHPVQNLRESQIDQAVFFPHIFARTGGVVIEMTARRGVSEIRFDVIHELRENNACVLQFGGPALDPFERDKALVVYGAECLHSLIDRDVAFAHHAVSESVVADSTVLYVDVFDVHTEILNGGLGIFTVEAVRMMDVPESADAVARNAVKHCAESCRIAVYAVCFNKQGDAVFGCVGRKLGQRFRNICIVNIRTGRDHRVAEQTYKLASESLCHVDISLGFRNDCRAVSFVAERTAA